jgi:hypothetical protein
MTNYQPPNSDWFVKNNLPPPETLVHGDIADKLKPLKTWNWRQQGNQLTADTDHGPLTQTIPTNVICTGTDKGGMPILEKIKL